MPNGFWYASGEYTTDERAAGSAFSKGDVLTVNATSQWSRVNPYVAPAGTMAAIAASDSTNSINGVCVGIIPGPDTLFWGRVTAGSNVSKGERSGVSFATGLSGRYEVDESTSTVRVVVVKGTGDVDQSVESKALVKFTYAAGELNLS